MDIIEHKFPKTKKENEKTIPKSQAVSGNKAEKRSKKKKKKTISVVDDNKLGNVWSGRRRGRKGWVGTKIYILYRMDDTLKMLMLHAT